MKAWKSKLTIPTNTQSINSNNLNYFSNHNRQIGFRTDEHPDYYSEYLACWACGYDPAERREDLDYVLCDDCYEEVLKQIEKDEV